jgi:fluorothreonine transaldolase
VSADSLLTLSEITRLIAGEEAGEQEVLHLTANETVLSPTAQRVLSTRLANRYLLEHLDMREDSPSRLGNFLFRGLDGINAIERSATEVCRRMFGAEYAEFRCLSGIHAMQTSFVALSRPGDMIMRVSTKDGGHFLSELICRDFGRPSCTYAFSDIGEIDLDRTRQVVERERPRLLYIDAMNYLFPFPLRELKEMVGDVPIVFDASHTLGLMAGGQFQDPLREGADVLQANTHKTLFGPQKGLILGRSRGLMERISYTLSNALVSSQHTATTMALFIALHEAYQFGRAYAARVVENARYLAGALHRRGVPIVAADRGFTRNHMLFIDLRSLGAGPALLHRLLRANISANRLVAFEHVDTIRLGVQEITRRGYGWDDLDRIADWIAALLLEDEPPERIRRQVIELVQSHPDIGFCAEDEAAAPAAAAGNGAATGNGTRPYQVRGTPAAERPRWIDIRLQRRRAEVAAEPFAGARRLGHRAGVFEHQTDSSGNISFAIGGRIYVSASGAYIRDLHEQDFVEITDYADGTLHCGGSGQPSAESYMHYLMRQRVDAAYIVHNHYIPGDDLESLDVIVIPPKEYGSVELAEAAADACAAGRVLYVRRHGLVFWGRTLEETVEALDAFTAATAAIAGEVRQVR